MGIKRYTAEAYARMQRQLLPPGRLWRMGGATLLSKLFLAAGDELERVNRRAADLLVESVPGTAFELLIDFETELALPSTGSTSERRARIVELITRLQRFRAVEVKAAMASVFGLDSSDVAIIKTSSVSALAMGDAREIYRFFVFRDPALAGTYDVAEAQAKLEKFSHSHTKGHVIESIDMICDSPTSLCDRDILGV